MARSSKTSGGQHLVRSKKSASKSESGSVGGGPQPRLTALVNDWPHISTLEQARRLKELVTAGQSKRSLARALGVSDALIRKRMDLAVLPTDEWQAVQTGKVSMRRASKKVRQQRVAIRAHKFLAETHSKKNAFDDAYQTIKEWLSAETLLPSDSIMVLNELRREAWIEQQPKPKRSRQRPLPRSRNELKAVIQRCRPERKESLLVTDVINHLIEWFSCWGPQLIPDPNVRDEAMGRLIREFEKRA